MAALAGTYIHMFAVDTSDRLLDFLETERAFQRQFDRLLQHNKVVVAIVCLIFAQEIVNQPLTGLNVNHLVLDRIENVVLAVSLVYLDSK